MNSDTPKGGIATPESPLPTIQTPQTGRRAHAGAIPVSLSARAVSLPASAVPRAGRREHSRLDHRRHRRLPGPWRVWW